MSFSRRSIRRSEQLPWVLLVVLLIASTNVEATPESDRLVVIDAGRVITVTGEDYSPGMVVIEDGEITLVGQNLEVPPGARRISARSETVMPGLVVARTRFGLPSYRRQGVFGQLRATSEVDADRVDGEAFLRAGIVAAAYVPSGSGILGRAGVVRPPVAKETVILREDAYLPITMTRVSRDRSTLEKGLNRAKKEIEKAEKAKAEWDKKQAEEKKKAEAKQKKEAGEKKPPGVAPPEADESGSSAEKESGEEAPKKPARFVPPEIPDELQPLVSILREDSTSLSLMVELTDAGSFLHWEQIVSEYPQLATEKHRNIQFVPNSRLEQRQMFPTLGEWGATVILQPRITNLPNTVSRVHLPAEVSRAGATVIFVPSSDSALEFSRWRSRIADLIRQGLDRDVALRAITEAPAQFLGIAETCGAIEKGRSADLIFLDGDPFAAATRVTRTMIAGEWVWEEGR